MVSTIHSFAYVVGSFKEFVGLATEAENAVEENQRCFGHSR